MIQCVCLTSDVDQDATDWTTAPAFLVFDGRGGYRVFTDYAEANGYSMDVPGGSPFLVYPLFALDAVDDWETTR